MKKVLFVIAMLFSLNAFSQQEKIMNIIEPYVDFAFGANNNKILDKICNKCRQNKGACEKC